MPGYPIALLDDGDLLTVEPEGALNAAARLHRLRLGDHGAIVTATRSVSARYGDAKVVGGSLVYVQQAADACEPVTHIGTFALDAALTPQGTLELPGEAWRIVGVGEADLVLAHSDGRSFARVALDSSGTPSLAAFATAPNPVEAVHVEGDVVLAIGGDQVVRLPL